MDEAVWVTIGVISALIAIGIIMSLLSRSGNETDYSQLRAAVQTLAAQCDQVCGLPENTALSVRITLPSGAILWTDAERLCSNPAEDETSLNCMRCACRHDSDGIVLNLTESGAFFKNHEFSCRYERVDTGNTARRVSLNCTG